MLKVGEIKDDPPRNTEGEKDNTLAVWLSVIGICLSVASASISFFSLKLNFLQAAHLSASAGETLVVNGQTLVGMSLTFTNDGARAKVINHVVLEVAGPEIPASAEFEVRSISPTLSSWTYDDRTGRLIEDTKIIHSAFDAFQVPGRGEVHKVIWFLPNSAQFGFREGTYAVTVKGYGENKNDLALQNIFDFRIDGEEAKALKKNPEQLYRVTLSSWR